MATRALPTNWLMPSVAAVLGTLALPLVLLGGAASGPVVALYPPWWDAGRSFSAAAEAGAVLSSARAGFAVVVAPDGAEGAARLRRGGAWLLLNVRVLAGCGILMTDADNDHETRTDRPR